MANLVLPQQNDLPFYSQWQELLVPVIAQLEKDFQTSGLDWDEKLNTAASYPALYGQLLPFLLHIIDRKHEQFAQLLYRIDISEAQIKKAGRLYPEKDFPQLITELIILRELQKVLIRRHYK